MIRSFLAIELPEAIRRKIEEVQRELRLSHADVRWVSPENIHLTLKFFGNIDESRIDPIVRSLEGPIEATSPFSLSTHGMGAFPHLKKPRVIWMGLQEGKQDLVALQRQIDGELMKIGFEPEGRDFHPHLTLGRVRSNRGIDELIGRMERYREEGFGDFGVERITLFKSDLKPSGPIYTRLRELKFGGL
ncbi:MAG: RNA 2',3'-cyclic phosphodiesterase [Thermodesulfobacteriota bacterium]